MGDYRYFGYPDWLNRNFNKNKFDYMVELLETGLFNNDNPIIDDGISLIPGKDYVTIKYHIDKDGVDQGYDEPCLVLGYNDTIPEYVKYKNENERIYVKSYKGGKDVEPITVGDSVFEKTYDEVSYKTTYNDTGKVISKISIKMFTYGNNNTYDVPMKITVDDKEYLFAGYNLTFQTRHNLKNENSNGLKFKTGNYSGRWNDSLIRKWLNSFETNTITNNNMKLVSLPRKVKDEEHFLKNVVNVVNRSWTYNKKEVTSQYYGHGVLVNMYDKVNTISTTVDTFWLLGNGNINCIGLDFGDSTSLIPSDHDDLMCYGYCLLDMKFDTSIFNKVFPIKYGMWGVNNENKPPQQWLKYSMMLVEGNNVIQDSPDVFPWWLRSASAASDDGGSDAGVISNRETSDGDDMFCVDECYGGDVCGVSPAFTIG